MDLNKADLIDNVVQTVQITQKEAEQVVEVRHPRGACGLMSWAASKAVGPLV